jgi:hypothetical protein
MDIGNEMKMSLKRQRTAQAMLVIWKKRAPRKNGKIFFGKIIL